MMKKKYNYSLLVYMKKKYAYTDAESKLDAIAAQYTGTNVGGGTDLTSGKRDQQFLFVDKSDAKKFLSNKFVKQVILKDVDLVDYGSNE